MKVLLLGRGVISATYGWALEQAGNEVEFLVRPGRAAAYGETIRLELLDGRRRGAAQQVVRTWPVRYREALEPDHDFDLVVLSVAHHRLAEAAASVAPRLGGATVLVLGNVWAEPADAVHGLPLDRVVWGFPGVGGGFTADGVLRAALLPGIVFGTLGAALTERDRAVRGVFRAAGFRIREQRDLRGWLWLHMLADAGVHAQGLRLGSLSKLIGRPDAFRAALLTTRELLPLLRLRGAPPSSRSTLLYRAPARLTALLIATAVRRVPIARRSLEAHTDPLAEEPRAVVRDVLAEVRRHGLSAPRLEAAEALLR